VTLATDLAARFRESESLPNVDDRKRVAWDIYFDAMAYGVLTEYLAAVLGYTRAECPTAQDGRGKPLMPRSQPSKRYPSDLKRAVLIAVLACGPLAWAGARQTPSYSIQALSPATFPTLPGIPWPPVRELCQSGAVIRCPTGTPPPAYVRFRDRNGLDYELPVTGATPCAGGWAIQTPHALVPHLLHGIVGVSVGTHGVTESLMTTATMP
jgi:hypothetical protein